MNQSTNRAMRRLGGRHRWRLPLASAAAAVTLSVAACNTDKFLAVQDPDVSRPSALGGPGGLRVLLNAAIGDFQVGFSGEGPVTNGTEGLVNLTGLFTDEFFFSETFPTRLVVDRRDITPINSTMRDIFFSIQKARVSAATASAAFARYNPKAIGHSEALNLEAYTYVLMGETYCNGVPISSVDQNGIVHYGAPESDAQLFATAVAKFDTALSIATALDATDPTAPQFEYLARVGGARALIDESLANLAAAATMVGPVPTNFEYRIFHSKNTQRQYNGVWELMYNEGRWVQSNCEDCDSTGTGGNGLYFRNGDPRTAFITIPGATFTAYRFGRTFWGPAKYASRDSAVVLASGIEARLIQAEAQLNAGGDWLGTLNALRATVPGLAPLTDPGTPTARQTLLFTERAFWMYATGHRLGDLRRLVRQYGRNSESVFPSGVYYGRGGGHYGTETSFPIPFEETNNPNFKQCTNTDA